MNNTVKAVALSATLLVSTVASATQINQQLACQAHLSHIENKLDSLKSVYSAGSIMSIRNGVKAYKKYLLEDHIEPGMKQFPQMQAQVDQMQAIMTGNYDKQFAEARFFSNNALIINGCFEQFRPTQKKTEQLTKNMIDEIATLAIQQP